MVWGLLCTVAFYRADGDSVKVLTEQKPYGAAVKPLSLKCINCGGCYFRLPGQATEVCAQTSYEEVYQEMSCSGAPAAVNHGPNNPSPAPAPGPAGPVGPAGPAPGPAGPVGPTPGSGRRLGGSSGFELHGSLEWEQSKNVLTRQLAEAQPSHCTDLKEVGTEMSASNGVSSAVPIQTLPEPTPDDPI